MTGLRGHPPDQCTGQEPVSPQPSFNVANFGNGLSFNGESSSECGTGNVVKLGRVGAAEVGQPVSSGHADNGRLGKCGPGPSILGSEVSKLSGGKFEQQRHRRGTNVENAEK